MRDGPIYVEMTGRLGNQMFRYAFARWLQSKGATDEALVMDFSLVTGEKRREEMSGWEDSLQHFRVRPYSEYNKEGRIIMNETSFLEKLILGILKAADKVIGDRPLRRIAIRKPFLPILNRHGIYHMFVGYDYPYRWVPGRKLVCGPFECARYCEEIRDMLLEEFVPKYPLREENENLMRQIESNNSVCITVRRGNFLEYPVLNVCTKYYFEQAARKMLDLVDQPLFVVFSDDVEWAKRNLRIPGEALYESGCDPVWEKLRLMYSCKHFIISNSTFSWWAQFLGRHPEKIVIAPDHWFNSEYQPPLYERGWILQSVEEGQP